MAYQIFPNIILLVGIVGIIVLIVRRLPEAAALTEEEEEERGERLGFLTKDDFRRWAGVIKAKFSYWLKRLWNFVLEAKGMRHQAVVGYKIKQIFKPKPKRNGIDALSARSEPQKIRDENYFLMLIKKDPHNLDHYKNLGEYYLDLRNYSEAANVYEYLVNHDTANSSYYAKFGYCKLRLGFAIEATRLYEKSIALDATHPNRFYNLALAYEGAGDLEAAVETAEKALALEPLNKKYQHLHADLDKKRKR